MRTEHTCWTVPAPDGLTGSSPHVGEPQHGLKGQNISYLAPGLALPWAITEPDKALLTHETNTCKLFKKISIKLPGWLRAAPIHSAHAPSSTPLQFHCGKFLGRPKSLLATSSPVSLEQSSFWGRISSRQQAG